MPFPTSATPRGTMMKYAPSSGIAQELTILISLGADDYDATDVLRFAHLPVTRNGRATHVGLFNWALDIVEDDHASG